MKKACSYENDVHSVSLSSLTALRRNNIMAISYCDFHYYNMKIFTWKATQVA